MPPLNIIEGKGFQDLINLIEPAYSISIMKLHHND